MKEMKDNGRIKGRWIKCDKIREGEERELRKRRIKAVTGGERKKRSEVGRQMKENKGENGKVKRGKEGKGRYRKGRGRKE